MAIDWGPFGTGRVDKRGWFGIGRIARPIGAEVVRWKDRPPRARCERVTQKLRCEMHDWRGDRSESVYSVMLMRCGGTLGVRRRQFPSSDVTV